LVICIELDNLSPRNNIKHLNETLVISFSLLLFVESDEHLGLLVKCIGFDLTVTLLLFVEKLLFLEEAEKNLYFLQAERVVLVILSKKKLIVA
jgi:hypothetical protein